MNTIIFLTLAALAMLPLILSATGAVKNKKLAMLINIVAIFTVCIVMTAVSAAAAGEEATAASATGEISLGAGLGMLGAALVTGLSCIAAGLAVSSSASAAIGALSENQSTFGKALIFVAMAEGIGIYGVLISIQILSKI